MRGTSAEEQACDAVETKKKASTAKNIAGVEGKEARFSNLFIKRVFSSWKESVQSEEPPVREEAHDHPLEAFVDLTAP